jgi:predicted MFS family arabinose efflux permease
MAITFLFYYFVSNSFQLLLVQILLGVSGAIASPAYDGVYSKFLDKGKFVSEWGMWETVNSGVLGRAASAGGLIVFEFGFRTLFLVMFVLSLLGLASTYYALDKTSF